MANIFNKACADIKLVKDMNNDANVKTLQLFMTKLGIYDGYCRGNFGSKTKTSVEKLQKKYSLGIDGWVGEQTCTKINEICTEKGWTFSTSTTTVTPTTTNVDSLNCDGIWLKNGSTGENVKTLQRMLKTLGYYVTAKDDGATLQVDGKFGKYTEDAVIDYQKANFKAESDWDGVVGPATCKKLNASVLAMASIKTSTSGDTAKEVVKVDPNAIDKSKNVFRVEKCNLHIGGIHLPMSELTQTNAFRNGNWNRIELMNGKDYVYQGRETARQFTAVVYLTHAQYDKLAGEFYKMQNQKIRVACIDMPAGNYTIKISVAYQKQTHKKVSFEMTECI